MYSWVLDSLPPRYKMVSELPGIVSHESLYNSLICAIFWIIVLAEMFLERMVASSLVKPGRGIAANSSSTKWTWQGRAPWWIWSAL